MIISKNKFTVLSGIAYFGTAAVLMLLLFHCFLFAIVPSTSMVPTYQVNDILLVRRTQSVERGDCVVFYPVAGEDERYVKRVVGLAGDSVLTHDGYLYINGEKQEEPYLAPGGTQGEFGPYIVPEGCFFAMGDNRQYSHDCRYIGPIPYDQICGVVLFKI